MTREICRRFIKRGIYCIVVLLLSAIVLGTAGTFFFFQEISPGEC